MYEPALEPLPEPVAPEAEPERAPATAGAARRITRKHVLVVAALILCSIGVAIAALNRSVATELPMQPVLVSPGPPASSPPPPMVRVHVAGAVVSPGVVSLPAGAIVQDAIAAAGGLSADADPALLNLAAPLADGQQIAIGTIEEPLGEVAGDQAGGGGDGVVDLNSATVAELEALPGVGPVTAEAIVAWREEHGRFTSVEELQEVSGIGPKTYAELSPLVQVR